VPHNQNTIHLLLTAHGIDAGRCEGMDPPSGVVLLEMLPEAESIGVILLPDVVAGKFRPDVAVVLATGPDVSLPVGATVAVRPYDGEWIEGFDVGNYATKNQVRFVGRATPNIGEIEAIAWDETIPLQFIGEDFDMVATGRNLIIRRDPIVAKESGFDLPDPAKYRTGLGTVLSIGPDCDLATRAGEVSVGDRIHYNDLAVLDVAFGGDPDIAIIPDLAVNLRVTADPCGVAA
jgi:co-chaperonin GroES (HSP10)